ncbi:hypothetical protein ACK32O_07710 [Aeromonas enteropelogenes]|uniref:hypothetical protein n=1 Tax=Aeromonas enteropelogenes TaxID=29489 RepID=UPI003987429F
MKGLVLGTVLAMCSGSLWANGLSPKLHNDTCQYHAALAKEFMGMRLDGKTKAEVLADVKKRSAGWDSSGLPKEYGDVNKKLVELVFNTPPLEDLSEKEVLLDLVEETILEHCLGQKPVDQQEQKPSEMYPNGSDYRLGNAHDCNRVSSYALDVMKKRQEQGGLLSDKLTELYKGTDEGATVWWGIVTRLTIEAYKMPQWPDEVTRQYMADQFANMAMAKCLG